MAYKAHSLFIPPSNSKSKIWRYMDLAKFLSILDTRSLYFARLDQLAAADPFEGYYTSLNIKFDDIPFEKLSEEWKDNIKTKETYKSIIRSSRLSREHTKVNREVTFVNSWHVKEYESAAMWSLYLSNHEGICIQSTFDNFVASLESYEEFDIYIGKIKYIDYEREAIPMGNLLSPYIYKRKSFEHEEELRALIWTPQNGKNDGVNLKNNKFKDDMGLYVPVNIEKLIEGIFVSPSAPKWIANLIRSIVEKYEIEAEVVRSDLSVKPIY